MNTNGNETHGIVTHEDLHSINISFQVDDANGIPKGAPVYIKSNGKAALAVGAVLSIGAVTVPVSTAQVTAGHGLYSGPARVTVITRFATAAYGKASGVVADGDALEAVSHADGVVTYKKLATANAQAVGVAIRGGANGEEIHVGLF